MDYPIGEFANSVGVSIDTLRYYEKEGLLSPQRNAGHQRRYSEKDKAWIAFIMRLKVTAMPIREIKAYAALRARGDVTLRERMAMLTQHQENVRSRIAALEDNLAHLEEKIATYQAMIDKNEAIKSRR